MFWKMFRKADPTTAKSSSASTHGPTVVAFSLFFLISFFFSRSAGEVATVLSSCLPRSFMTVGEGIRTACTIYGGNELKNPPPFDKLGFTVKPTHPRGVSDLIASTTQCFIRSVSGGLD
jgi:hypothetical protein